MNDVFFLQVRWAQRADDVEQCALRLTTFLTRLAETTALFQKWYRKGNSREEALERSVKIEYENLKSLVEQGKHLNDLNEVIPDLGYSISLWTSITPEISTSLSILCGCYSKYLSNTCLIYMPSDTAWLDEHLQLSLIHEILTIAIKSWEPDWAVFTSRQINKFLDNDQKSPYVGWVTYLSDQYRLQFLPENISIDDTQTESGVVITIAQDRTSAVSQHSLKLAQQMSSAIKRK